MSIALTQDQTAFAESVRGFCKRHAEVSRTRAEFAELTEGGLPSVWQHLVDQGFLALHLPEDLGGADAGVVELAILLEETARALVPGPLATSLLTSLTVARHGAPELAESLLPRFAEGATAGWGTTADGLEATRVDGAWEVSGTSAAVLGALSGQYLLLGARTDTGIVWFVVAKQALLDERADALSVAAAKNVDLTRDVGSVTLARVRVEDTAILDVTDGRVRDLAATLFAAEAAGLARWCLETGVEYVKVREQFGKPVGSFQAIKHKCARLFADVELMTAAAWDAAVAADQSPEQSALAAAAAAVNLLNTAARNALETVTLLGGIGYTWEHDVHLYWRRAIALSGALGPVSDWEVAYGELSSTVARERVLDLVEPEGLRADAAELLGRAKALPLADARALLAENGFAAPHFPKPYGLAADAVSQVVIAQEFEAAGIARSWMVVGEWALPTILAHGTEAQAKRFAMPTLSGEIVWCQLFSEPGAGSDLASLRTAATRTEDGWVLKGQKVWTSGAQVAHWGICLARTDATVPKHKGLSYFLVDMTSPGIEIRPLQEANGDHLFNEVFLNDVFVPDELLVGEPGKGWELARTTLGNERVSIGSGFGGTATETAAVWAEKLQVGGPHVLRDIGRLDARGSAFESLVRRGLLRQLSGMHPGAASSVLKVASTQYAADVKSTALNWAGPSALTHSVGGIAHAELSLPQTLIGGGTIEIQLNIIGERVLGLPRS